MKIGIEKLYGHALDWAVTYALYGEQAHYIYKHTPTRHEYSSNWDHAGPLMEKNHISVLWRPEQKLWWATMDDAGDETSEGFTGETMLIAGMRVYVQSEFGDYVDVPEELT